MRTIALLTLIGLAGCMNPSLTVKHLDPRFRTAEVWIDGERQGTVSYNDELTIDLNEGAHGVKVHPPGVEQSPWHPNKEQCVFVVEDEAVMTLVPAEY